MMILERRAVLSGMAGLPLVGALGGTAWAQSEMKDVSVQKAAKYRGVVYDLGVNFKKVHDMGLNAPDGLSVAAFDPALVEFEIKAIRQSLNANAIRIEGEIIERLVIASRMAHKQGLTVFFNPWKMNETAAELQPYYAEAARAAEILRSEGVDIVFVMGCEYSLFQKGIFPGDTINERIAGMVPILTNEAKTKKGLGDSFWDKFNATLKPLVDTIRTEFKGNVTYAALMFEQVDWGMFDIVGIDHYRGTETAKEYVETLKRYRSHNKPVVCMEVGSCTYVGAAKAGGGGFFVLEGTEPDGTGRFKDGKVPERSEREQADYVETQVKLLANNGVDGLFVFSFSMPMYPTGDGAKDMDRVSYALVKTYPKTDPRSKAVPPWTPKESFHRLAALYAEMNKLRG